MNRLKLLYIHQILTTETDEQHSITLDELRQRLADKGITAERKALYKDLDALRPFSGALGLPGLKYARVLMYNFANFRFNLLGLKHQHRASS